jgi:hypothetical protein
VFRGGFGYGPAVSAPNPPEVARVAAALAQPSYTPARRDLGVVARLIGGDDDRLVAAATRAILRVAPDDAVAALVHGLGGAAEGAAARLVAALGQVIRAHPTSPSAARGVEHLIDLADRAAPRPQRAAIVALGKVGGEPARLALRRLADRADLTLPQLRALAEALGKVGIDHTGLAAFAADLGEDVELGRRRDRAVLIAARDRDRTAPSSVRADAQPSDEQRYALRCRAGLEDLLAAELGVASDAAAGVVRLRGRFALARLLAARTWTSVGLVRPLGAAGDLAERIASALTDDATRRVLAQLTDGVIRWRLAFAEGGHRRAVVWDAAQRVRAAAPELVNDPTQTTWDVVVFDTDGVVELRPRRLDDPRFAWRVADISAASHPTIAAALARVAGVRADDVVWDPFCGSGSELVERALLGPCARAVGSDLDARALAAARQNVDAAGITAELVLGDALTLDLRGVSLVITNPPLGRRIRGDAGALLERFVARLPGCLAPGGRLVWVTPAADRTERAARAVGLRLASRRWVDLGGFEAAMERWESAR